MVALMAERAFEQRESQVDSAFLAKQLEIFQAVTQAVNSSLILEDIFEALAEVLGRYIPYREASIVILEDTQNGIKMLVRMTPEGDLEIIGENHAFAGYDPVVDGIVKTQTVQRYADGALPETVVFEARAASALIMPLVNKGVVIGLLAMAGRDARGFGPEEETLLTQVSAQIAVAVENAKLYLQTQSQASREFLINQLTMAIRQSLDIDVILSTAVVELGKVLGVSRCFIRYFPGALAQPVGALSTGESPKVAADTSESPQVFAYTLPGVSPIRQWQPGGGDFESRVFALRKEKNQQLNPFILNDVRDCPAVLDAQAFFEENRIKSLAVIPILIREQLVGTMTLHQCDMHRAWVNEDIELLKAMAEHLGVALHQANLFLTQETQKRQLEETLEELQQAQLYLIQSEKMAVLGQFVAGIAHEVNTPLGTMMSNNDTLKTCFAKLKADLAGPASGGNDGDGAAAARLTGTIDDLLNLNKMAAERILDIVKNLRNFARLDESELKTVDIHEGIESTLLVMKSSLNPAIVIERDYGADIPPISCYPGLLNQVFMNMVVNATHALEDKLAARERAVIGIETRVDQARKTVSIRVSDTGKGIAAEHLNRIFDPGFTTKGVGVGTGLGLALCYRIVEKHHGRIEVESKEGEGTAFTVVLPL